MHIQTLKNLTKYSITSLIKLALSWLHTKVFYRPARLVRSPFYIRGYNQISFGKGFTTGVGVRLDAFSDEGSNKKLILIGDRVQINDYVHIGAIESICIGDDVLIASKVFISDHNHGQYSDESTMSSPDIAPIDRPLVSAPIIIESKVWVGENVCILPGVTIGSGAVVGAGSVVTHDVPADSIAVGVPAKVVKVYDRELSKWIMK